MALIGRLHPLLIHFPIALVISAAVAEVAAAIAGDDRWHVVAVGNVRAGAIFGVLAAIAGWRLALDPGVEMSSVLEWHRWLGTIDAGLALAAALATTAGRRQSSASLWTYRTALFAAGVVVVATGHLGGVLVWGANFLRQ
jgi:uncharacterized membrane protein